MSKVMKVLVNHEDDTILYQIGEDEYVPFTLSSVKFYGSVQKTLDRVNENEGDYLSMSESEFSEQEAPELSTFSDITDQYVL